MIKLDYSYSSVTLESLKKYEKDIKEIVSSFKNKKCQGCEYTGWYNLPNQISDEQINEIDIVSKEILDKSQVFVVCGIGGSYLGARAVIESIKGFYNSSSQIIYLGNTFDEKYMADTINYLKNKEFCVNVISKSGSTLETAIAFRLLKNLLAEKYGEAANSRIYVTTDEKDGCLRKMCENNGYRSFVIPKDVGGRYSVFTPVGLLPLAVAGVDIRKFIKGASMAYENFQNDTIYENVAYQYAAYRYLQYKEGKKVELFASYSPYLNMISEWWKQLFGESEGKDDKGLFPASVNFSTDLHSLGQFIQQGSKIMFVTQLKINEKGNLLVGNNENDEDGLNYLKDFSLSEINKIAQEGTNKAHYHDGNVDNLSVVIDSIEETSIGSLLFFFMCSCMISACLLGVNPFNQPGVEYYKSEMKKMLKKE